MPPCASTSTVPLLIKTHLHMPDAKDRNTHSPQKEKERQQRDASSLSTTQQYWSATKASTSFPSRLYLNSGHNPRAEHHLQAADVAFGAVADENFLRLDKPVVQIFRDLLADVGLLRSVQFRKRVQTQSD